MSDTVAAVGECKCGSPIRYRRMGQCSFCYKRDYYVKNRERLYAKAAARGPCSCGKPIRFPYYNACNTCTKRRQRLEKPEQFRAMHKRVREKLKSLVFNAYGNKCACCGEAERLFLSLDHVNGGGRKHYREAGGSHTIYRQVRDAGFPSTYQILCMNCNFAKGHHGFCPHKSQEQKVGA